MKKNLVRCFTNFLKYFKKDFSSYCYNEEMHIGTGFRKFTLVARGADAQPDPSCVSAPLASNVDLYPFRIYEG